MARKILKPWLLTLGTYVTVAAGTHAAEVYQWTDENGRTVFSSTAPRDRPANKTEIKVIPGKPTQPRASAAAPVVEKPPKTAPEQPQPQRPDPAVAARNCSEAQRVLQVLETTPRPRFTDSAGQIRFLDEAQKAERRAEARRQIEENCP